MEEKVTISIIDSGIDTKISDMASYVKSSSGIHINKQGFMVKDKGLLIRHIHGTIVGLVIRDLCKNIEINSINILNERLSTDGRILLNAIELALSTAPDILHLSLGTTSLRYWFPLKKMIWKARKSKTVIVAAANNEGKHSYPAYLNGVVGVKVDPLLKKKTDYYYKSGFFYAPVEIDTIEGNKEIKTPIGGSSTAAAFISGHIARIISENCKCGIIKVDPIEQLKLNILNQFDKESQ